MIYTTSQFNYGQVITTANNKLVVREAGDVTVTIEPGTYTLGQLADTLEDALNTVGTLGYSVDVDRMTNNIVISASVIFTLRLSQSTITQTLGFTGTTDVGPFAIFTSDQPCGSAYVPQFLLQSYVSPDTNEDSYEQTVNQSASGRVELVRFGVVRKIECEMKFITNLPMDGRVIRNNQNGIVDATNFLRFAITKAPFEFVPGRRLATKVYRCVLESTPSASDGTGFKLKELFDQNIPDVYETGLLTLRVL